LPSLLPSWNVGTRTGDTTSSERARQTKSLPPVLVTTPESLTLLLSKTDAIAQFKSLDMVIVDEWHELMGSKRGAQTQLALARLRKWRPQLVVWGLSATLGNLRQAQDALLGTDQRPLVEGAIKKDILVDTLIPENPSRFPWGGHLGIQMLQPVIAEIDKARDHAGFHQHPFAGRNLVSRHANRAARLGRPDRAASRLARTRKYAIG
jgi:ATP-dependent Lhr-like helicase